MKVPQQFHTTIANAESVLITFRQDGGGDAIGSALALAAFLKKMGKRRVDIVAQDFRTPKTLAFLPGVADIFPTLSGLATFTVNVQTERVKLKDFRYDTKEHLLRIFLTPEEGMFRKEDVTLESTPFAYDCIIVLDTPGLESLGAVYAKHADFFYQAPVIAIDHDPENEQYGDINLVDITASSTGEILYELFHAMDEQLIDAQIATALVTAIVAKTRSFRTARITPRTLTMTSELVQHGADREQVMHNLFRTRSLATLKLWGRVLARLEHDAATRIAWSSVAEADFTRTGATREHLDDIIDELIAHAPNVETTVLFSEHPDVPPHLAGADAPITVTVATSGRHNALDLMRKFNPKGSRARATATLDTHTMEDAKNEIIAHLKTQLA